jgi:hypothetical protein
MPGPKQTRGEWNLVADLHADYHERLNEFRAAHHTDEHAPQLDQIHSHIGAAKAWKLVTSPLDSSHLQAICIKYLCLLP